MGCSSAVEQLTVNQPVAGSIPAIPVVHYFIMAKKKELTQEELFPYDTFPIRLEHPDGKDKKICWFQCEWHLDKYIDRHKIKKRSKFVKIQKKK
jgi:hypothetical protein